MKGNFMQLKRFLESQYPELQGGKITGQTHPPTFMGEVIGAVTQFIWFGGIAILLGGAQIFSMLGMKEPEWYDWMKANKGTVFIGLFIMNNFGASMMTTGAFEVYLDNELIYSKLQTGRMPTGPDITAALARVGLL
jgi:thioredoxin reductase-like selenoprotein T